MSRKGVPYDNAVAENFFSCFKCELIHLQRYDFRYAAQIDLFSYIEAFYNTLRPHSALGWLPPTLLSKDCATLLLPDSRNFEYSYDSLRFFAFFDVYFFEKGSVENRIKTPR